MKVAYLRIQLRVVAGRQQEEVVVAVAVDGKEMVRVVDMAVEERTVVVVADKVVVEVVEEHCFARASEEENTIELVAAVVVVD